MKRIKKIVVWICAIILSLVLLTGVAMGVYVMKYYHATEEALQVIEDNEELVTEESNRLIFTPEHPTAGLIFYPGGKVQYESYAPLMEALADQGIMCVLLHMPGNLAVFDINAAEGIIDEFPEIDTWYLGGHSLGGVMAASYLSKHVEDYAGIIFLASYTTEDLSASRLNVLSIYGSNDEVLSMDAYKENVSNFPADYKEHVIEGGCHAMFGSYGEQAGDGTPTISADEQIKETVEFILENIR